MSSHLANYRHARVRHHQAPTVLAVPAYVGGLAVGTGIRLTWGLGERTVGLAARAGRSAMLPPAPIRRRAQAAGPTGLAVSSSRRDSASVRNAA